MSKIVKNKLTKVKENAIKYLILSVIDVKMYKSFYRNIIGAIRYGYKRSNLYCKNDNQKKFL